MSEQPQPPSEAAFFTSIREWGLVRGTSGVVGGVIDGVGNHIGLARVPARLLTVVAWILLPGVVMLAYAAGWALLPDHRGNIIIQNFGRGVTNVGALIGIAVLTFLGILGFDSGPVFGRIGLGSDYWGDWSLTSIWFLIPVFMFLAFLTGVVFLIVWLVKRSNRNAADAPLTPAASGTPATGGTSVTGNTAAPSSSSPSSGTTASSNTHQEPGTPQPWEPALLPGDPRAGVPASNATVKPTTNAAHTGTAHTATGSTGASGTATASAPVPPTPPAAPARPPAPTVPGPGRGAYLAFGAVLLISAAIAAGLARADMLAVSPILAWGAAITVGLGAILMIVALAGRKLGFLGFLSVFAVLLAVLFAANASDIRTNYNESRDWWDSAREPAVIEEETIVEEVTEDNSVNLMTELGSSYSSVLIDGACLSPSEETPWDEVHHYGESMASMRLDTVDDDMNIDLTATYTRLVIPAGTGLEIHGTGQTIVVWEDRDVACSSWYDYGFHEEYDDFDHDYDFYEEYDEYGNLIESPPRLLLSASNPDVPVITVNADMDKSIYIQEVAK